VKYPNLSFFRCPMNVIPIELTEHQFEQHVAAFLSHGARGPALSFIGYIQVASGENLPSLLLKEKKRGWMADGVWSICTLVYRRQFLAVLD
jgi:hypothetical protein